MTDHTQPRGGVRHQMSPVEVAQARARSRPNTDFASTLRQGASSGLHTASALSAGYLPPGGAVVSAALSGAGSLLDAGAVGGGLAGGGALPGGALPGGGGGGGPMDQREVLAQTAQLQREGQLFNVQMLHMQDKFARDQQSVNMVSNLLKKKDETIKNTLMNFR